MLRIRLSRVGATHRPFYHFVVSDSRKRPGATAVDRIGHFDPTRKPPVSHLDLDRAEAWISKGAVPSPRVEAFIRKARRARA